MKVHPPYLDYQYFRRDNWILPQYLLDLSILAYAEKEFVWAIMKDKCVRGKVTVVSSPGFSAIVVQGDQIVVAFRGTMGLYDWSVDMEATRNEQGFHRGFWNAVEVLVPKLAPILTGTKDVVLTGHSLGAAMSAIATIQMPFCKVSTIMNFGQPRIGNQEAVNLIKDIDWTRYVHGDDLVAKVPPTEIGYVHGGKQLNLPQIKVSFISRITKEWPFIIPQDVWDHIPTFGYAQGLW